MIKKLRNVHVLLSLWFYQVYEDITYLLTQTQMLLQSMINPLIRQLLEVIKKGTIINISVKKHGKHLKMRK